MAEIINYPNNLFADFRDKCCYADDFICGIQTDEPHFYVMMFINEVGYGIFEYDGQFWIHEGNQKIRAEDMPHFERLDEALKFFIKKYGK